MFVSSEVFVCFFAVEYLKIQNEKNSKNGIKREIIKSACDM